MRSTRGSVSTASQAQTPTTPTTTATSSPPTTTDETPATSTIMTDEEVKKMEKAEKQAHEQNIKAQRKKTLAAQKRAAAKTRNALTKEEAEKKAQQLDDLLTRSDAFSQLLMKKTSVLGRVGTGLNGKALGEKNLTGVPQPKIMTGGTMRDYQLEGLAWMFEIWLQGLSGILADEMGLGKTIQTIGLIAKLREGGPTYGPHLIVAPLSTLSNWIEEFEKWCPTVPVVLYHGDPKERKLIRDTQIYPNYINGRPTKNFPVVCTSYEIILRDKNYLNKLKWGFIIIDEGHRLKNFNSQLFQELRQFESDTRMLISGTPLQNNLRELWSLLNFLMPEIFADWQAFESWFDFSDLQDIEGTEEFIADQKKQELVKKIHVILQPLLLRRIKADVEHLLPRKREYVLYAPLTEQQAELCNALSDKTVDSRKFLQDKLVEHWTGQNTPAGSERPTPGTSTAVSSDSDEDMPLAITTERKKKKEELEHRPATRLNVHERTILNKRAGSKRKLSVGSATSSNRSAPSVRMASSSKKPIRRSYHEASPSDDDMLSDDQFESRLAQEMARRELESTSEDDDNEEDRELAKTLEMAKRGMASKKLGNPVMQLRLACNSPHNFFNPWATGAIDETLVTSSGKMLLLDRLLPELFKRNHKVLIFSQFKTQLDILEDYARELRGWNVCRIDGSVAQDDRRQQIQDFNTDPDHKLFLLSTRAGGQGINLATADTAVLFDSDWNPQQDLQAIDRAHRIGQKRPVVVFRLATKGTVEEDLLMSAEAKRRLEKLVIKKRGFRTSGQTMDKEQELDEALLRKLLLKEGEVYMLKGGDEILSQEDLDTLCDRSEEAYEKAEKGLGNAAAFKVVENKDGALHIAGN